MRYTISFYVLFLCALFTSCDTIGGKAPEIYRIGRDRSFYPLDLKGKETNFLAFIDDLLLEIGKLESFQIELYYSSVSGLRYGLDQGLYDAIVTNIVPASQYEHKYEFSTPFFLLGPVIVVPIDSPITKMQELNYKLVGIPHEGPLKYKTNMLPSVIFKTYDNILVGLEDLSQGKIDGVIMEAFPAYVYTKSFYKGKLKVATSPLNQEGFRMMTLLNEKRNDFIDRFNEGLRKVIENGTFERLLVKWELFQTIIPVIPDTNLGK